MSLEEVLLIHNNMVYTSTLDKKIILDKKGWIKKDVFKIVNKPDLIKKPGDEIATAEEWQALKETVNQNKDYFSNIKVVGAESVTGAQRNIACKNENTNAIYITFLESQGETKEALVEYIDEMQQLKATTIQKMKAIYEMINTYVEGHKETDAMISKQIKNSVVSSK